MIYPLFIMGKMLYNIGRNASVPTMDAIRFDDDTE